MTRLSLGVADPVLTYSLGLNPLLSGLGLRPVCVWCPMKLFCFARFMPRWRRIVLLVYFDGRQGVSDSRVLHHSRLVLSLLGRARLTSCSRGSGDLLLSSICMFRLSCFGPPDPSRARSARYSPEHSVGGAVGLGASRCLDSAVIAAFWCCCSAAGLPISRLRGQFHVKLGAP